MEFLLSLMFSLGLNWIIDFFFFYAATYSYEAGPAGTTEDYITLLTFGKYVLGEKIQWNEMSK